MKKLFLTIIFAVITMSTAIFAQTRGGELEVALGGNTVVGKQWAVFIAIDEYNKVQPLQYPVKDAQDIKKILLDHYHIDEVRELYNKDATASAIRRLFVELAEKVEHNDSVFVFHAGHGINDEKSKTSAWIPTNGGANIYDQENWIYHNQVRSYLDSLKARHVFLISDSCFSGDLLDSTRGTVIPVSNIPAAYNNVSRQAMSSGASEVVDDVSEFASRLKNTLLRSEMPFITPDHLLSQIKDAQTARPLRTIPILAVIPRSSHQLGGSFLFFRKNPSIAQPVIAPATPSATTQSATVTPPATTTTPSAATTPQTAQPTVVAQGEQAFFVGKWITTVEINNSFDTIELTLNANGRCTVKVINDNAQQETTGNWEFKTDPNDNKYFMFKLNATFRNPTIAYIRNIDWTSRGTYGGDNSFHFNVRAIPSAPIRRITFFRDD